MTKWQLITIPSGPQFTRREEGENIPLACFLLRFYKFHAHRWNKHLEMKRRAHSIFRLATLIR